MYYRILVYMSCSLLILSLSNCTVGADFKKPAAPAVSRYTVEPIAEKTVNSPGIGGVSQHFLVNQAIVDEWWHLFKSPLLNNLINQGIAHSPNLVSAQAALRQAQATLAAGIGTQFFPALSTTVGASRQRYSTSNIGESDTSSVFNLYNTSVDLSYNLDLFGGSRRDIEALKAKVDYQLFQLAAARLTLAANIVTTAIMIASIQAQITTTESLIHTQQNTLTIIQAQEKLGSIAQSSVLTQQTQAAQTQATLPPLEKSLAQYKNALAVLIGVFPSEYNWPLLRLEDLTLPAQLPLSLPSQLVRQRPDIQASEALLKAASAEVGVASATMLPQISLTGSYGYSGNQFHTLFSPGNTLWSFGTQLTQPIFQAGALRANKQAAVAAYDQMAAHYKQTVLQAFQEVANSLQAIHIDAQALQIQNQANQAAKDALKLINNQYKAGSVSYLALLDAQRQYQQTSIVLVQAQAARYADTAALFQALGGSWWNQAKGIDDKLN